MTDPILFSRYKLETFIACRRRFQLRYLTKLPWPAMPADSNSEVLLARGQQFHQLLERHFLGIQIETESVEDADLRRWWTLFERGSVHLPEGDILPEMGLTVPVGKHLLTGRFDLLVVGKDRGVPFAHVFDWKTGRPQSEAELRQSWQTRLYLALLAEGSGALFEDKDHPVPERISITYWYVTDPDQQTINYNGSWHQRNWSEIQALVEQIDHAVQADDWPLTNDLNLCRTCAYQSYCGRQEGGLTAAIVSEPYENEGEWELPLEPELP